MDILENRSRCYKIRMTYMKKPRPCNQPLSLRYSWKKRLAQRPCQLLWLWTGPLKKEDDPLHPIHCSDPPLSDQGTHPEAVQRGQLVPRFLGLWNTNLQFWGLEEKSRIIHGQVTAEKHQVCIHDVLPCQTVKNGQKLWSFLSREGSFFLQNSQLGASLTSPS